VRVVAKGISDNQIKGTCLLVLPRYDSFRTGSVPLSKILGQARDTEGIRFYAVPARHENLQLFHRSEVEPLLELPVVENDPNLLADVQELMSLFKHEERE